MLGKIKKMVLGNGLASMVKSKISKELDSIAKKGSITKERAKDITIKVAKLAIKEAKRVETAVKLEIIKELKKSIKAPVNKIKTVKKKVKKAVKKKISKIK